MDAPHVSDGVAIVGYSHRMPGGIHSDSEFWRLLSEREIVQEPVADRYGKGQSTTRVNTMFPTASGFPAG